MSHHEPRRWTAAPHRWARAFLRSYREWAELAALTERERRDARFSEFDRRWWG